MKVFAEGIWMATLTNIRHGPQKNPLFAPRSTGGARGDRQVERRRWESQECGRLFPLELFHLFLLHLAVDAEGGHRPGHKPFFGNRSVADLAYPEDAVAPPFDCLLHLEDQLSLPIADPEFELPVRFD